MSGVLPGSVHLGYLYFCQLKCASAGVRPPNPTTTAKLAYLLNQDFTSQGDALYGYKIFLVVAWTRLDERGKMLARVFIQCAELNLRMTSRLQRGHGRMLD